VSDFLDGARAVAPAGRTGASSGRALSEVNEAAPDA
jgi:hypothetical protein